MATIYVDGVATLETQRDSEGPLPRPITVTILDFTRAPQAVRESSWNREQQDQLQAAIVAQTSPVVLTMPD